MHNSILQNIYIYLNRMVIKIMTMRTYYENLISNSKQYLSIVNTILTYTYARIIASFRKEILIIIKYYQC